MKTSKLFIGILLIYSFMNFSCNNSNKVSSNYHLEKKYWAIEDYDAAIAGLDCTIESQKLPNLSDNTAEIFKKIADIDNVSIVTEDNSLGLKHRDNFATEMFDKYKTIYKHYSKQDREDKYIYPSEIAQISIFGIYTQIQYFKLGNENIAKEAINPNSDETKNLITSNAQIIVDNIKYSLDICKKEDALTPDAIHILDEGYEKYLPLLFKTFPTANYTEVKAQINMLLTTVKSIETKKMLVSVENSLIDTQISNASTDEIKQSLLKEKETINKGEKK